MSDYGDLARLGTATIYEAAGRVGLVDLDLVRVVPDTCTAGPARPVRCDQGDIRMIYTALEQARPGDVLVLTMPEPEPLAMFGDLMAAQALGRDVAAVLVDGAVRDADELVELALPVWTRWVRVRTGSADGGGTLDEPITVGGVTISAGDIVVLDGDGAVVIEAARVDEVRAAAQAWDERERAERAKLRKAFAD
jgi:4-hydroxy-4-methyl-2-oxoglutarate aldolase